MAKHPSTFRLVQGALLALCLSLLCDRALADTRVVVRSFSGPAGADARRSVVRELGRQRGIKIISNEEVDRAARRRSVRPDGPIGRREVGRDLEVAAWVEGSVRRRAGKLELSVVVRGGDGNEELASFTAKRKKAKQLDAAIHTGMWRKLGSAIESARAPESQYEATPPAAEEQPSEPPMPVAQSTDTEEPPLFASEPTDEQRIDGDDAKDGPKRELSAIQAALTMNTLHRSLQFNDAFSQGIADYSLGAAPMADLSARIYPAAFLRQDWTAYIGLDLHAQLAFALKSEGADKQKYPTSYEGYGAGLVGRYPLKQHEVNAIVGYDIQRFRVDNAGGKPAAVPSVDYRMIRYGLGGKVALMERLKIGIEAAWLLINSSGELASKAWFPQAKGNALEGTLYADVSLIGALNARARVSYQRAYFDFNSRVGDTRVAGGATDDYLSGGLGVAYAY